MLASDMPHFVEAGTKVGRYSLVRTLGTGGMAEVWEAEDDTLKRSVAIKIALPNLSQEDEFVRRFFREAQTAARLEHPHIVPIYDVGMHEGRPFLVMPLLSGGRLSDRMSPPREESLRWLLELASALDYAHGAGIIHRDVKPQNAMFDGKGRLLLTDFGLAKSMEESTTLSLTGAVMGTPAFMAPEQAMGDPAVHPVVPASDQYALGMIAYRFVAGRLPFDSGSAPVLLHKKIYEALPPPSTYNPDLSLEVDAIFERALARSPEERFANCVAFVESLSRVMAIDKTTILESRVGDGNLATPAAGRTPPPLPGPARAQTAQREHPTSPQTLAPRVSAETPSPQPIVVEERPAPAAPRGPLLPLLALSCAGALVLTGGYFFLREDSKPKAPPKNEAAGPIDARVPPIPTFPSAVLEKTPVGEAAVSERRPTAVPVPPTATALPPLPPARLPVETVHRAASFTIVLKGGARIVAKERFRETGRLARYQTLDGKQLSVPLERIDLAATERANPDSR